MAETVVDLKGSFSRIIITEFGGMYQIKICDPETGKQFSSFEGTFVEVMTLKNALLDLARKRDDEA